MTKTLPRQENTATLSFRTAPHANKDWVSNTPLPRTLSDAQRLIHELVVRQIELEMLNAQLTLERKESDVFLKKITDLYDSSPVGYFTIAADGTIREANLTAARMVGIYRSLLAGRSFALLLDAPHRAAFKAWLQQIFADHVQASIETFLIDENRSPIPVSIEACLSSDGRECRAVVADITERKQAVEQLRVSEIRYRRLFEAAHDGVLLLDPASGKILDANPFMTRLLGYPLDVLLGKELFQIGLLKDEAASQAMFHKLQRNREVRYENLPLESQDGRHQEVEVVANIYQENDCPVIQCNIRDITARKQSEHEMRNLNQQLESRVLERTLELQETLAVLEWEIRNRRRMEHEILEISKREQCRLGQDLHDGPG